jgi:hypothetical protein
LIERVFVVERRFFTLARFSFFFDDALRGDLTAGESLAPFIGQGFLGLGRGRCPHAVLDVEL